MIPPPFPAAVLEAARDAAKAQMRIAGDHEDALIEAHAASALALCEAFTGRAAIMRDWTDIVPASRAWQSLGAAPVHAIDGVETLDADGAAATLAPAAYAIDIDANGEGWIRVIAATLVGTPVGRIRVTFSAGLADDWDALPAPLRQGVVLLIAHLFEARGDAAPPAAVAAFWRPWRRLRLEAVR